MPYQEMFRRKILNYSALDFGKIEPPQPLPFTTTSDTMGISMKTEKTVYPVGMNTSTVFNSLGIGVEKGRNYDFKAWMYNLVNDNKPGTYKIYKRIGFDGSRKEWYMSAEFRIE